MQIHCSRGYIILSSTNYNIPTTTASFSNGPSYFLAASTHCSKSLGSFTALEPLQRFFAPSGHAEWLVSALLHAFAQLAT